MELGDAVDVVGGTHQGKTGTVQGRTPKRVTVLLAGSAKAVHLKPELVKSSCTKNAPLPQQPMGRHRDSLPSSLVGSSDVASWRDSRVEIQPLERAVVKPPSIVKSGGDFSMGWRVSPVRSEGSITKVRDDSTKSFVSLVHGSESQNSAHSINAAALADLKEGDRVLVIAGKYRGEDRATFVRLTSQKVGVLLPNSDKPVYLNQESVQPYARQPPLSQGRIQNTRSISAKTTFHDNQRGPANLMEDDGTVSGNETKKIGDVFSSSNQQANMIEDDETDCDLDNNSCDSFGMDNWRDKKGRNSPAHLVLGFAVDSVNVLSSQQPQKFSFAFQRFCNRLFTIKRTVSRQSSDSIPTRHTESDGRVYELLFSTVDRESTGTRIPKNELTASYVLTQGGGLPQINLMEELGKIAGFGKLPEQKVPARLELLGSKIRKATAKKLSMEGFLAFDLMASDFELIEENGNEGCGFIPRQFIEKFLGKGAVGLRTFALQVRIYAPSLGVFKGVLVEKCHISRIQLPLSMKKVGPSVQNSRANWAHLIVTSAGIFPSKSNLALAQWLESGVRPTSFLQRKLSPMLKNLLVVCGASSELVDDYSLRCVKPQGHHWKRASLIGVIDPTGGSIPDGNVFLTGPEELTDSATEVFVTRFPCTSAKDGCVIPVLRTKPPSMMHQDWAFLQSLCFGAVIFPSPPKGQAPMPTLIANGDLDGDLYFCCWDEEIIASTSRNVLFGRNASNSSTSDDDIREFREVPFDPEWLVQAQRRMADVPGIARLQALKGILFKRMEECDDGSEYKRHFEDAFKESLDVGKHGGKIFLPAELWGMVDSSLHTQLTSEKLCS